MFAGIIKVWLTRIRVTLRGAPNMSMPKENTLYCYYHYFGGHLEIKNWQNNNKTVQEITQACKRAKIQSSPSKISILALR